MTTEEPKESAGLVIVLTGDGKGKTSAALGIALRAVGYDMHVCIVAFIKGNRYTGEIDGIKRLSPNVELHLAGKGFCGIGGDSRTFDEHRTKAQEALALSKAKLLSGAFDVVILDEINNAVALKLVDISQVTELIDQKPPQVHLVLTGRDAPQEIIARAHTVTEMKEVKHAYHAGIRPRKGIDF
jgi:cob(I)alamin adenosyltransferase